MKRFFALVCMVFAVSLMLPASVFADGKGHGKGHGKRHDAGEGRYRQEGRGSWESGGVNVTIELGDRNYIQRYLSDRYRSDCPPGLAKKHNGCLPPGQAKKRYAVGQPLPAGVFFEPVPIELLGHLRPAPYGYRYVQVDRDVLLIGEATKHVVDAVTLLSAVGR